MRTAAINYILRHSAMAYECHDDENVLHVDTLVGTEIVPCDLLGLGTPPPADCSEDEHVAWLQTVTPYLSAGVTDPDTLHEPAAGVVWRLQMPGYSDCTDWSYARSEHDAVRDAITEHCDASPDTDINWQEAAGYTVNRSDDRGVIVTLPGPGDVITRAGTGDHVSVWQHPEDASCYYILTRRDNLDYYGITVWAPENGPEEGSGLTLFSQDPGAPHGWSMLSDRELLDMHHGAGDLA